MHTTTLTTTGITKATPRPPAPPHTAQERYTMIGSMRQEWHVSPATTCVGKRTQPLRGRMRQLRGPMPLCVPLCAIPMQVCVWIQGLRGPHSSGFGGPKSCAMDEAALRSDCTTHESPPEATMPTQQLAQSHHARRLRNTSKHFTRNKTLQKKKVCERRYALVGPRKTPAMS
jgi:hypothetical protein